jgi:hypothetical protein
VGKRTAVPRRLGKLGELKLRNETGFQKLHVDEQHRIGGAIQGLEDPRHPVLADSNVLITPCSVLFLGVYAAQVLLNRSIPAPHLGAVGQRSDGRALSCLNMYI